MVSFSERLCGMCVCVCVCGRSIRRHEHKMYADNVGAAMAAKTNVGLTS